MPDITEPQGRGRKPVSLTMSLVMALLLGGLGFAIVSQSRTTESDDFSGVRGTELAELLRTLDSTNERLGRQIDDLTATRDDLKNSNRDTKQAEAAARKRADTLKILAGAVPVEGPGVVLTLRDTSSEGSEAVTASVLVNAIQELRDAGAEAIAINGTARVVAQTYILDDRDGIRVGSHVVKAPFVIDVIGDASTLAPAMRIRGGVIEQVTTRGGAATVTREKDITIKALADAPASGYAQLGQ